MAASYFPALIICLIMPPSRLVPTHISILPTLLLHYDRTCAKKVNELSNIFLRITV